MPLPGGTEGIIITMKNFIRRAAETVGHHRSLSCLTKMRTIILSVCKTLLDSQLIPERNFKKIRKFLKEHNKKPTKLEAKRKLQKTRRQKRKCTHTLTYPKRIHENTHRFIVR